MVVRQGGCVSEGSCVGAPPDGCVPRRPAVRSNSGRIASSNGGSPASGVLGGAGRPKANGSRRPAAALRRLWWALPLAVLAVFAALFVGGDVLERRFFPTMPTAWRHALLTFGAGLVTAAASAAVYVVMRRQERLLSATASRLSRLLESYTGNAQAPVRFENPHLKHCRDMLICPRAECPMHSARGQRCWQVMALSRADPGRPGPHVDIQQCHACSVYRSSCPDPLTELGESFNNLMFLLEEEAAQVGRMRAQMLEKEKMVALGQLAAGVAHEVGNPLSSISSIVQMLRRGQVRKPKPEELDLIETHIQRISSIVRQLAGQAQPGTQRWESLDIGKVIDAVIRLVRFDRRARNVEIVCRLPETSRPTFGLRDQLQQVFLNLTLNALDAMPQGGKLTIEAKENHRHIVVTVADTGCGIRPEVGRRVFEPFYTTKEPGQGTGLGLSVSYGIIETHGGTIDFDSVVGQGTEFAVKLPIRNKPPEA